MYESCSPQKMQEEGIGQVPDKKLSAASHTSSSATPKRLQPPV